MLDSGFSEKLRHPGNPELKEPKAILTEISFKNRSIFSHFNSDLVIFQLMIHFTPLTLLSILIGQN